MAVTVPPVVAPMAPVLHVAIGLEHNHTSSARKRLVLQVYLGLNTLEFSAIYR